MNDRLLSMGAGGTAVVAMLCCTPAQEAMLGAIGLPEAVRLLDPVLYPALLIFIGITGYALWQRRSEG